MYTEFLRHPDVVMTDDLEKIIYMLLGPIRHSYTAKERAAAQGIGHFVYPRYTRTVDTKESRNDINGVFSLISTNIVRNEMILEDTRECVQKGRTPVLLTKYKEHARYLYDHLQDHADHVFLLYGDNTDKENIRIRREMKEIPKNQSVILVATVQKIGEGFDFPGLDTLMLASPVSFSGRLRTYKRTGFQVVTDPAVSKQAANAIYDSGNYADVFERDVVEAGKRIIVSSPRIAHDKIERFLYILKPRQEAGVDVTVITTEPENLIYGNAEFCRDMIESMRLGGIQVILKEEVEEHFAVIDDDLVWHGGMNLLGKEDAWDNLMRIQSLQVAEELLEIVLGNRESVRIL